MLHVGTLRLAQRDPNSMAIYRTQHLSMNSSTTLTSDKSRAFYQHHLVFQHPGHRHSTPLRLPIAARLVPQFVPGHLWPRPVAKRTANARGNGRPKSPWLCPGEKNGGGNMRKTMFFLIKNLLSFLKHRKFMEMPSTNGTFPINRRSSAKHFVPYREGWVETWTMQQWQGCMLRTGRKSWMISTWEPHAVIVIDSDKYYQVWIHARSWRSIDFLCPCATFKCSQTAAFRIVILTRHKCCYVRLNHGRSFLVFCIKSVSL